MNVSFWLGVLRGILLGIIIGFPVSSPFVRMLPVPFVGQLTVAVLIAALYVLWTYHKTPTRHRTAILLFDAKRLRFGPEGKGYTEGLNCMLLGWPFFYPTDKVSAEQTLVFNQEKAYSKDNIVVMFNGTVNLFLDDVYNTYNIQSLEQAIAAVTSMVLKWIRTGAEKYTAIELVSQEANGADSIRGILAKWACEQVQRELSGPDAAWGYNITSTLQISHISLDGAYEGALRQVEQEKVEGQFEKTQIDRRLEQIDALKAKGINADLAATFAQVEAGKPGAQLHTFNIPGLQGIGEGLGNAGQVFSEWLKSKTGSKGAAP